MRPPTEANDRWVVWVLVQRAWLSAAGLGPRVSGSEDAEAGATIRNNNKTEKRRGSKSADSRQHVQIGVDGARRGQAIAKATSLEAGRIEDAVAGRSSEGCLRLRCRGSDRPPMGRREIADDQVTAK